MKKFFPIVITFLCILGIIGGCVCWYVHATRVPAFNPSGDDVVNSGD